MTRERTSRPMKEQIKTLYERGYSLRSISKSLKVCRKTIRKYLFPDEKPLKTTHDDDLSVDWEAIEEQYARGATLLQLYRTYASESTYLKFWRAFRKRKPATVDVTMRLYHKPGERAQIDFTDGLSVVDRQTGLVRKTQLFCAVMPFSSLTFGEFVEDQKLSTFISSHDRLFHFLGGVPPYIIVDNLKSGVKKAHLYDPDVNPTFCEYANHMGFAVLPARPYTPRDKASVESNIGVVQKQFYQEVRNQIFYSIAELNEAFQAYLNRLNHEVMKDYGISRWDRFQEEKKHLRALPARRFERTEWSSAKVHPDCHIQVARNFYSVPYRFVGQVVRVRRSNHLLEVFSNDGESLTSHALLEGKHRFSTNEQHYPGPKVEVARFEASHARAEAEKIGPLTVALVSHLLEGTHPLRYLRRIQGILRLSKSLSKESLEYASKQAMLFHKTQFAYVKACAEHFELHGPQLALAAPERDYETLHLHQRKEIL